MEMTDFFSEPTALKVAFGSFVIGLSGAVAPGPLLVRVIERTPRFGSWTGPVMISGHAILELALVVGLGYGLGAYLQHPTIRLAIALVGGVVLALFAVAMVWSLPNLTLGREGGETLESVSSFRLGCDGVLTTLSNPYWSLWWATVGLGYMTLCAPIGTVGTVAFYLGHIASDFAWYAFVSVLIATGMGFITDRAYRGLVGICAAVLGAFAILFISSAFT